MKKFFTLTVAFVLSFSAYAQTSVFQRDLNKRGYAKLTTTQASTTNKVVANKIEPTANQVWWGYQPENEARSSVGVSKKETYDAAIFVDPSNSIIVGKTIKAIRFYLRDKAHTNNVKVWISKSLPSDINNADYVQNVDQAELNAGDESEEIQGKVNDVALNTPYVVGSNGVYIGYTLTVTDASEATTKFPIVDHSGSDLNGFFIRSSETATEWTNLH